MPVVRVQKTDFARRLRQLRDAAGLTQFELSKKVGITHSAISRLERGERSPLWEVVVAMCRAMKVTPNQFLGPDDLKESPARADADQDEDRATKRPRSKKS
jgi:transcriptional regulator with XRE-family HTH domain